MTSKLRARGFAGRGVVRHLDHLRWEDGFWSHQRCAWWDCRNAPTRRVHIQAYRHADAIFEPRTWPWLYYCDEHPVYLSRQQPECSPNNRWNPKDEP